MAETKTLCELEKSGFVKENLEDYKLLVKKGKFVCSRCGRVARKKKHLCHPDKL